MTRIKICGITNRDDALLSIDAGADALGFIAVPSSPRYVSSETVATICQSLPPFVTTVVVAQTLHDGAAYPTDRIQFYDECDPPPIDVQANRRIRVFRVKDADALAALQTYPHLVGAYLLDTYHEKQLGGVGETFDWQLAVEAKRLAGDTPLILAGGLNPHNVGDAIRLVRPYAVDVSSGVEAAPGRKDAAKVRAFVQAVRAANES